VLFLPSVLVRRVAAAGGAILVLFALGPMAAAGEPPRLPAARVAGGEVAPPVQELVARALANAPSIAARRERLAAAQAAAKAADVLPDPMLEFEVKDAGFPRWTLGEDPMSMIGATIRQPLVSKGRKASRLAAATAEIDIRHAETDAAACDLTAAVRITYGRLYAVDRERAILRDSEEMARLLVETATARYASGSSDQAVVLRAQLERTRLSERVVDLDAERATLVVAMNRLMNEAPDTPLGEVRELPEIGALSGPPGAQAEAAANLAPEVSLRKAEVAAATRRVDVRREEFGPNWTIGGSFFWQGGVARVVSFTVGVDWPWRKDRNQGQLLAASESELRAARLDLEDTAAGMRAEAARLAVEIKRAEDQIVRYRSGLLPQSSAALDAARVSYLGGRGDFASVLDEFRRWTEIRVELVRREASRFAARAQLDVLVSPAEHGDWGHGVTQPSTPSKEPRS
jgi:outer membrane protein, heavy metal efflux system